MFLEHELVALWRSRDIADRQGLACYPCGWDEAGADGGVARLEDVLALNRMTLRRCEEMLATLPFRVLQWRNKTPRPLAGVSARSDILREYVVTRAMLVLEK